MNSGVIMSSPQSPVSPEMFLKRVLTKHLAQDVWHTLPQKIFCTFDKGIDCKPACMEQGQVSVYVWPHVVTAHSNNQKTCPPVGRIWRSLPSLGHNRQTLFYQQTCLTPRAAARACWEMCTCAARRTFMVDEGVR